MLYTNRDLKKLIVPLIVEQTLAVLVGLVDTVMIAGVGEAAMSGVSLVDTVNILIINVFAAFATGGAVVAGHFLGQKNPENASKAAWQLILFSSVISIAVSVVFVALHKPILDLIFGQVEADVMNSATSYLIITAFSIFPLAVYNGCAALFRAMNNTKITMWVAVLMNLINIAGNAVFIYGFKLGAAGAATATTLSRTVSAVILFVMLYSPKQTIHLSGNITWHFDKELIKKILYIGVPNGLENSLFQLGKILLMSLISTFGTYAMAANAVCNTIAMFNILPGMAISNAILSVAAVCVGAGEYKQARYYTKKLMFIAMAATTCMTILILLFRNQLVGLYRMTPQAEELAIRVFCYHAIMAVFFWVLSFCLPNTLRAAGDVVWTMVIAGISMWIFRIAAAYIFSFWFDWGLFGIWVAMTIDWVFRAVCYSIRYMGSKWEKAMPKRML